MFDNNLSAFMFEIRILNNKNVVLLNISDDSRNVCIEIRRCFKNV